MQSRSESITTYRRKRKNVIIQIMGGKCQCCGYNKSSSALELHHIDPNKKEFGFGKIAANPKKWEIICRELEKCMLVCANCHREIHHNNLKIPKNYIKFNFKYKDYSIALTFFQDNCKDNMCKNCGKFTEESFCSSYCESVYSKMINWKLYDLHNLYIKENKSCKEIAKIIGCNINSVFEKLKDLNIEIKPRKSKIISKDELKSMIWEIPTTKIAIQYGVSGKTIEKWCKKYKIKKPPRGYWQKIRSVEI